MEIALGSTIKGGRVSQDIIYTWHNLEANTLPLKGFHGPPSGGKHMPTSRELDDFLFFSFNVP